MTSKFEALRAALPGVEMYTPGDAGYEDSLFRWSATCIKPAAVVVRPTTAAEVSIALVYAAQHKVYPLAVCGGGHSTSGDQSSDGGMVIDLKRMRSTRVDPVAQTISFGGGCDWADVNAALWEHGLATVSGVVGDTGVGGLILGGGYGYLTGRRGLALDCLLSCEVVLASGEIVTASKAENPDLFWALRGAGHNFGIVTSFTSEAYPQGLCWAGFLAFPPDKLKKVIEFGNDFRSLVKTTDGNSMLSIIIGNFLPPDSSSGLLAVLFHNGTQEEGERVFQPLLDLEPLGNTTSMLPYTDVNMMFNKTPPGPKDRHLFGGASFTLPLDPEKGQEVSELFWETFKSPENIKFRGSTMTFEYHSTVKIREVGVHETAFANRGQYSSVCTTMNWTDEEVDLKARTLSRMIAAAVGDKIGWKGDPEKDGTSTYANYFSHKTRAEKIFGPNAPRLRELKAKYDPNHVFKKIMDLSPEPSNVQ
ncbi:hypothetical protein VSDG_05265 [Cytospora chrysosperma]|uniref:FAD-binding PCMH-type domain-containing protein n=1 Tax=Cytospora chrysosperma TaxID=252740 RepID=A0A423VWU9_CYTCH|nr:hypothetical protein VSDG_05265 [Valsa sordida]